jgi:hypothetical protein
MREFIDLIEAMSFFGRRPSRSIVAYCAPLYHDGQEYPVYKNGSRQDLQSVIDATQSDKSARGFLDHDGNLYFWDSHGAVHYTVERMIDVKDSIYLRMDMEGIMIVPQRRRQIADDAEEIISANRNIKRLQIPQIVLRPDLTA